MTLITAKKVAKTLQKSLNWVYDHALDLGAKRIGGSWIFTKEGLDHAIQGKKRDDQGYSGRQDMGKCVTEDSNPVPLYKSVEITRVCRA